MKNILIKLLSVILLSSALLTSCSDDPTVDGFLIGTEWQSVSSGNFVMRFTSETKYTRDKIEDGVVVDYYDFDYEYDPETQTGYSYSNTVALEAGVGKRFTIDESGSELKYYAQENPDLIELYKRKWF